MKSTAHIRKTFLNYFEKNDHKIVHSSPLVPINDPTLMFVNAGMVPFKNYFEGKEEPEFVKATSSQKCVRAGGKHNDLDNVGHTARHLTFFEMLGNFSFGEYFKEEAIRLAWDLLVNEFEIPSNRLLLTVFKEDTEAEEIWKKVSGFSDNRIIKISTDDNFWSMGDEGPCGPCSEIFFDHGDTIDGGPPGSKNEDGDRFVEIWNLVFMQYLQLSNKTRESLPKPSIDTGMGLERISTVLQGKTSNFDTDLFLTIINYIEDAIKINKTDENIASFRVIADHLRSIVFLISDGVLPSNEGRGYVLRRIMRRAMRHAYLLNIKEPILYNLVKKIIALMSDAYPELLRAEKLIEVTVFDEEERFISTLSKGIKIFNDESKSLNSGDVFSGSTAFKLYDTYGFPLDLTEDLIRDKNLKLDKETFDLEMRNQKEEAKKSWLGSGDSKTDEIWFEVSNQCESTDFLGYQNNKSAAEISKIIFNNKISNKINNGDEAILVFNQSPFYAESGGQMGDIGIAKNDDFIFRISDTQKKINNIHAHYGVVEKGSVSLGDTVYLQIENDHRRMIMCNHSATHLLHEALRRVLGDHVTQKGSQVSAEKLRFDFSHQKSLDLEEIIKIEEIINNLIKADSEVMVEVLTYEKAVESGALALFGEKYDSEVRVLTMGHDSFSKELCGGTHVKNLGEIKNFKIISQNSVASGIRRVEAVTGSIAFDSPSLIDKINEKEKKQEEKKQTKKKEKTVSKDILNGKIVEFNKSKFFFDKVGDVDAKNLRHLVDECKKDIGTGIVCLISTNEGKSSIAIGVTDDLLDDYDAVELVKISSETMGGKGGGGRKDMALAGAKDLSKSDHVFEQLLKKIKENT
ncbi:MAG: alanine--tRNA ligase [Rhodobiaceae bacterium]|nr:alanine--tRNA ligase [Rhodobiaceae bacterium]